MEIKTFRVEGTIRRRGQLMSFSKAVRAIRSEDAVERIYADLGSQHHARRFDIAITSIAEVSTEEKG